MNNLLTLRECAAPPTANLLTRRVCSFSRRGSRRAAHSHFRLRSYLFGARLSKTPQPVYPDQPTYRDKGEQPKVAT